MHKPFLAATLATALSFTGAGAFATDLQNLDDATYSVTLSDGADQRTLEVAPLSDITDLCDGCVVTLADGQSVETKGDTMVSIVEGKLISDAE